MPKREIKEDAIIVKGARVHNLKNIHVVIPRDQFIVITGLSGSGKSSLAFDTLYAEGQRRYIESLSAYARQFLGRITKPDVDFIHGIPPAIAIEQKVNTRNPRSTVGTSSEVYDYIKLMFARIGKTFSPVSGKEVRRHTVGDVVRFCTDQNPGTVISILAPVTLPEGYSWKKYLDILHKQGFSRIESGDEIQRIDEITGHEKLFKTQSEINLIIDRLRMEEMDDISGRIADSVQTAFFEGRGRCMIKATTDNKQFTEEFSTVFEADGLVFEEPCEHLFSFNNPLGACPLCEGYGQIIGIDEDLVIPDKSLSIYQDAIACWKGDKMQQWKERLILHASKFNFPIHKPFFELSEEQKQLLWTGNTYFYGLNRFFKHVEEKVYKIQYRVLLSRFRGKTRCTECKGTRLKKQAGYVKIRGLSIHDIVQMPVQSLYDFFQNLKLTEYETSVTARLMEEIRSRLRFLLDVGLGYLTLNRLSSSLSGGESQRINLATSLGSSLVGSLYVLDEPSIGLHPRDTGRLIKVLRQLQEIGNTVLVVEHDESIIRSSDVIIDMGPMAGRSGGEIVFQGKHSDLITKSSGLTMEYLRGIKNIPLPSQRRKWTNAIEVVGAGENNLKNISVKFPLDVMTVVTGVSGSGKTSLVRKILYPALKKLYNGFGEKPGKHNLIKGDTARIKDIEFVDQYPAGKSSRSNPVTYIKAYDDIRNLFGSQQLAKYNGYTPSHFSFNIKGGRCEDCQGEGMINVEMQFMADVRLVCESCLGKRFRQEILDVTYQGKNIYDVLEFSVNEAIEFFGAAGKGIEKKITAKLKHLADVGLGYLRLGQPSSTLSGGESQRVKLALFLSFEKSEPCLFIFDEPTIGLHFHDVNVLLEAINALIKNGHSVIIIEHNLDVIKSADWIIDLGPEGGDKGGYAVFEGTPEQIIRYGKSYTGKFLKDKISGS